MKSVISSIFLLFLFKLPVALAYSNMCFTGYAKNSDTCGNVQKECIDSQCMTISQEFRALGQTSLSISKRCAMNLECNKTLHVYSGLAVYLKQNIQCCSGDGCNSANFYLPDNPTEAKGMLCPDCSAFYTTKGCTPKRSTICLGEDDQCIRFRGIIQLPSGLRVGFSAQGCCSKNVCEWDFSHLLTVRIIDQLENTCYDPTSSPTTSPRSPSTIEAYAH